MVSFPEKRYNITYNLGMLAYRRTPELARVLDERINLEDYELITQELEHSQNVSGAGFDLTNWVDSIGLIPSKEKMIQVTRLLQNTYKEKARFSQKPYGTQGFYIYIKDKVIITKTTKEEIKKARKELANLLKCDEEEVESLEKIKPAKFKLFPIPLSKQQTPFQRMPSRI
ncbi:hypothetical protein HOD75_03170 [archaeon]|jgi:hypothetical protein|nr:hypothetical protein [archaeon]MBT4241874.1 hypothetical protein [archaeon]MBT4418421.1 hypothetical protein [archaeon]